MIEGIGDCMSDTNGQYIPHRLAYWLRTQLRRDKHETGSIENASNITINRVMVDHCRLIADRSRQQFSLYTCFCTLLV